MIHLRTLPIALLLLTACAHSTVDVALPQGVPSIAYAAARNGRIVYEGAVNATPDTPYPIASVTKPFVATAVMKLAQRGIIDLDQPARRYARDWIPASHRYTVRQLLNHASGLPTYATIRWTGEPSPRFDLASMFGRYGFTAHPPGVVSEYSNLGYGLLGHIVAVQSGQTLARFLEREVFRPIGLRNTTMIESGAAPPGAVRKYGADGNPLPDTFNDTPGAGNIYASVDDLIRFGMYALYNEQAMYRYVQPGALYPYYNSSKYGLGWYFRTTADGTHVVWHEGGMPGASAIVVLLPEHDIVAAVVINSNDHNDFAQTVANRLIASLDPAIKPLTFDPVEGFVPYDEQPSLRGRWEGTVTIDGKPLRCAIEFDAGGKTTVAGEMLPQETSFKPLLNGDLVLGTFAATLPAEDVMQKPGYVLVRLVRRGDEMSGTMIAYATPDGLRHLYPFAVHLRRQ
ncbi:MAG TPA: serine hydrolase domain-containing protein [Thermoanaerobaculia bacterium]|nr:serine hydrolase domain-containing protein [Thermoanaerobaculia bacterium]